MAVNGKHKGSTFERKIANKLSERFEPLLGISKGFKRNSDSGSYFGGKNISRTENYDMDNANFGDIVCPKNFKYSIECKHYKQPPSFQSVLNGDVAQWNEWITQAEQDSKGSKKLPLLIIKYNNVKEFVFVKQRLCDNEILQYRGFYCYTLLTFLALKDSIFFSIV